MKAAICTLFEGHYHLGVAALANSLYVNGYRGSIYAGYKGARPTWANSAKQNLSHFWPNATTYEIAEGLDIHFLPVQTEFHLTNYKPLFMLRLLEGIGQDIGALAYFDPDIVVKCRWDFIEVWMSHGVALVHDICNDMPASHPLRKEWEKVIRQTDRNVSRSLQSYFNGGFCGVARQNFEFLNVWADIINTGIKHFNLTADQWFHSHDRTFMFYKQDQDALNMAAMCSESPICEMGPEAMDFVHGGWTMSHAVGVNKPWNKKFLWSAINGNPPSSADKAFWSHVSKPIAVSNPFQTRYKYISILLASFIARFYRKT